MSDLLNDLVSKGFSLDHIGVAVNSLEEGQKFYQTLGLGQMSVEEVPTEKVKVGMFKLKNSCQIELLEATSEESSVAKFIAKRGPGIHHICFRVDDLDSILVQLKEQGVKLINQEPRPGAHGCRVAFIHPAATGGVLVELSEPSRG